MVNKVMKRAARRSEGMRHRWRVSVGLAILAVFVGIGVVPARRGLTVRYHGAPPKRPKQPARRRSGRRRRAGLAKLFRR
jgi:hypothetical protein